MPVVNEDTFELLCLTESDSSLYESCLQSTIDSLRKSWRYSFGMWRKDRLIDLVSANFIGHVRGLIEASENDEITSRLAELSIAWRDVARELIADVVANPDATAEEIACGESARVALCTGTSSAVSPMPPRKTKETPKQETGGGPEKSIRLGNVSASVFVNQTENGRDFRNVVFQRSYLNKAGEREYGTSFNVADLPVLERVLKLAQEYVEEIEAVIEDAKDK